MLSRIIQALERYPPTVLVGFVLVATPVLGLLDYLTGPELSFSIFYLLPVSVAAWYVGRGAAYGAAALSALTWLVSERLSGHVYSSDVIPIWNAAVRLGFFVIVSSTLLALRIELSRQQELAGHDPLTGLANRRQFLDRMRLEIERSGRLRHPLTLAYIDLDHFKEANDRLGHAEGDALLQLVARILRDHLRPGDVVARLGGDEFALLLPATDPEIAPRIVTRLNVRLLAAMEERRYPVTFSIGVGTFLEAPSSADAMITAVDDLMYRAKRDKRGTIRTAVFSAESLTS